MALTDDQIRAIFDNKHVSSHNGFHCLCVMRDGVGEPYRCSGETRIRHGRLEFVDNGCGEPCSFVCDNARKLSEEIEQIKRYDTIITKVKDES